MSRNDESSTAAGQSGSVDATIVGGGIAGLWLLNVLRARGYQAILVEADALGCDQTLASQGMIHGGIKYTLGGALSGASEAIAAMPERWRALLREAGEPDLSGLEPLAERYHLFAASGSIDRLVGFFASRALRGRIEKLPLDSWPEAFGGFDGVVYGLPDFVLDTSALLHRLLAPVKDHVYRHRLSAADLTRTGEGWSISLGTVTLATHRLVLAAGAGNGPLLEELGLEARMQLRPLHQVLVRRPELPALFAHCVTSIRRPEPRLTITSHPDPDRPGQVLWYLGGQIATDGVARSETEQIAEARRELERCVPWIDWTRAQIDGFRIDRAEPARAGGLRPDEAFVANDQGCLVCWPTKLTLVPDLADRVLAALDPPRPGSGCQALPLPRPTLATPPWAR